MMSNDFDDFIDRIMRYFKLDSDMFDVDFLFIPESDRDLEKKPNDEKVKSFKISYHYEPGMDKPEIKVEGNLDDKNIHEYLRNIDLSKVPKLKDLYNSPSKKEIDASKLSLETSLKKEADVGTYDLEPYAEICENEGFSEIMIEIPGMDESNINIRFENKGKKLIFTAETEKRRFMKSVNLPFKSSETEYEIEVNNGIAIIKVSEAVK